MKQCRTVLIGDINIDAIMEIVDFPSPGNECVAKNIDLHLGGSALNTTIVLTKMGVDASILGCIGDDIWGEKAIKWLSETGVNTTTIISRPAESTGVDFIAVTPDGNRTMFGYRGANTSLTPNDLPDNLIEKTDLLHLSGYAFLATPQRDSLWHAVKIAQVYHKPISLDVMLLPIISHKPEIKKLLSSIQICILGMEEAKALLSAESPDAACDGLLKSGISMAAIKLGDQGSYISTQNERYHFPAIKVSTIDTTGAGDAFSAGIIYGFLNNYDLQTTGILANMLGAIATTIYGGGIKLPGKEEIISYMEKIDIPETLKQKKGIEQLRTHLLGDESLQPSTKPVKRQNQYV